MVLPVGLDFNAMEQLMSDASQGPVSALLLAQSGYAPLNPPEWIARWQPQVILLSVGAGDFDVFFSPVLEFSSFLSGEGTDDFCGTPIDKRAVGDFKIFWHERMRPNDALVSDLCAVENCCAHSDEAFVADGACVKNGSVPNCVIIANVCTEFIVQMDDDSVLQICSLSDADRLNVRP